MPIKDPATIQQITDIGRQFSDATILMHEAIAQKAGLSGADHKYLHIIMRHGTMTAGELARHTGLTTGAVTGLVDRLEKSKLAKRVFDKTDRRRIIIEPNTALTQKLLGGIFSELQKKMVALVSTLNSNERMTVENYLLSAIDIMNTLTKKINKK